MTILLTIFHALTALILFWYSAESKERRPLHRALLYAFGFSMMCWASANLLEALGRPSHEWVWMIDLGHWSMAGFALMWIIREGYASALIRDRHA